MSVHPPAADQFLVSHGKSGIVGVFTSAEPMPLRRGSEVVIESSRGLEIGTVLGPATLRQARLIGATSAGSLLRPVMFDDEAQRNHLTSRAHELFEVCRAHGKRSNLTVEILDVDLLLDGQNVIVQFVGAESDAEAFALSFEEQCGLTVRLENLAVPTIEDEHEQRCDKPDCGKDAGGCSTCSTGGGCSSCGSSKVDMAEYFGHLRTKLEASQRIPLA